MSMGIVRTLERKESVIAASPGRHTGLRSVAENLDRRNADAAVIELLTEALHRLVTLAYVRDRIGFINTDAATGRILIPVPMGRAGRSKWGLYPAEGIALGIILRSRQAVGGSLFFYDSSRRAWHIDLANFPTEKSALAWLKAYPIVSVEYRAAHLKALGKLPR